jgi:hypothetical protein
MKGEEGGRREKDGEVIKWRGRWMEWIIRAIAPYGDGLGSSGY